MKVQCIGANSVIVLSFVVVVKTLYLYYISKKFFKQGNKPQCANKNPMRKF